MLPPEPADALIVYVLLIIAKLAADAVVGCYIGKCIAGDRANRCTINGYR